MNNVEISDEQIEELIEAAREEQRRTEDINKK